MDFEETYQMLLEAIVSQDASGAFRYKAHEQGQSAEDSFKSQAIEKNYQVITANSQQDATERWDFLLKNGAFNGKVDVKSSNGYTSDYSKIYIKIIGTAGYGAEWFRHADYIAIQTRMKEFVMYERFPCSQIVEKLGKFKVVNPDHRNCYLTDLKGKPITFDRNNATRNRDDSCISQDKCVFYLGPNEIGVVANVSLFKGHYKLF